MYCTECGTENEDTAEVCKKCNAILTPGSHHGTFGRLSLTGYSDQDVGLLIISIGVVLGIAAVLPFFLLETKDLITMERMLLIITLPLAFIAILLIGTGWVVYQGYHRRDKVLHKVEKNYRSLVENAEDGIFTIDQEGRFTYVNIKGMELLGYAKNELVGRNFATVIAPEYRETTIENFRKRQIGEGVDRYEVEVVTKEGKRIPVELNTRTLEYKGEFMGLEGIARVIVKSPAEKIVQCPRCWVMLNKEEVELLGPNVIIDVCPKCQGIWFDNNELDKVLGTQKLDSLLTKRTGGTESKSKLKCPRCGAMMDLEYAEDVEIDVCPGGHGAWLDYGELERLKELTEAGDDKEVEAGAEWAEMMAKRRGKRLNRLFRRLIR
ncbi:Methyl sulfide methyltransferase-associated sensor [ANME-1 cluster archaeon GoMg2]|nr:Methyl sulfide methyltransferase-associated sensor [ANME-1 cluster archaeon GoMg2]